MEETISQEEKNYEIGKQLLLETFIHTGNHKLYNIIEDGMERLSDDEDLTDVYDQYGKFFLRNNASIPTQWNDEDRTAAMDLAAEMVLRTQPFMGPKEEVAYYFDKINHYN